MSQRDGAGRPQRWDKSFGSRPINDADIDRFLALPALAEIDASGFSADFSLRGIIANDGRIRRYSRGDIIVRRGDYGNSIFIIASGTVRGLTNEAGEQAIAPTDRSEKKSWFDSLAQLWRNSKVPEYRSAVKHTTDPLQGQKRVRLTANSTIVVSPAYLGLDRRGDEASGRGRRDPEAAGSGRRGPESARDIPRDTNGTQRTGRSQSSGRRLEIDETGDMMVTRLDDVDSIISEFPTFAMTAPAMFGEFAALARTPRQATVFAATDGVEALELRWQGLREIRRWSDSFSKRMDADYRERGLIVHLRASPLFSHLDPEILAIIADQTLFESHGEFEWSLQFQRARDRADRVDQIIEHEPFISEQGHYLDGLLLIRSGFARVSVAVDHGERTEGYLTTNDVFGLEELLARRRGGGDHGLRRSLRAIGYVDLLRIPTGLVEQYVIPALPAEILAKYDDGARRAQTAGTASVSATEDELEQTLMDFLIDNRIINGTAAMLINTDRCVGCDDCVVACASTHGGNARFVRHGPTHRNLMVANACMHCVDPVCLIGCPTGAIHRSTETGDVIIDDATCVGCATCATSCPYNNIRMVETRDGRGAFIVDDELMPIAKATKCDFCDGQLGGPACQRACPHDALIRADLHDTAALNKWLAR